MAHIYEGSTSSRIPTDLPTQQSLFSVDPIGYARLRDRAEFDKLDEKAKGSKRWQFWKNKVESQSDHPTKRNPYALVGAAAVALLIPFAGCVSPLDSADTKTTSNSTYPIVDGFPMPPESFKNIDTDRDGFSDFEEIKFSSLYPGGPHKPDVFLDIDYSSAVHDGVSPDVLKIEKKDGSQPDQGDGMSVHMRLPYKSTINFKPVGLNQYAKDQLIQLFESNGIALHIGGNGHLIPVAHTSKEDCVRPGWVERESIDSEPIVHGNLTWSPGMPCETDVQTIDMGTIVTQRGKRFFNYTLLEDPTITLDKMRILEGNGYGSHMPDERHHLIIQRAEATWGMGLNSAYNVSGEAENPGRLLVVRMPDTTLIQLQQATILFELAKNFGINRTQNPYAQLGINELHEFDWSPYLNYTQEEWNRIKENGLLRSLGKA